MNNFSDCFLNINRSLSGKQWNGPNKSQQESATSLQQVSDLPYALALYLAKQRVKPTEIQNFLNPRIKNSLPYPYELLDMDKAVTIVTDLILRKKRSLFLLTMTWMGELL